MIRIVFKNLSESELAREIATETLTAVIEKFPDLKSHRLNITLSRENSVTQPGPDLFTAKLVVNGKKYGGIVLEKSEKSLYSALASVAEHTLERLNRCGDRVRVKSRKQARNLANLQPTDSFEGG